MKKPIIFFLFISLILTGCGAKQEVKPATAPAAQSEQAQDAKTETPNVVIAELLGQPLNSTPKEWGNLGVVGNGFTFEKLENVIFYTTDNNIISGIEIIDKDIEVYGSKVGQTLDQLKVVLGDPLSEGVDEESGGYLLEYEINDAIKGFYSSDDAQSPITNILLLSHRSEIVEPTSTPQASAKTNVQARFAGTYNLGIVIEVINAGTTPVKNVSVDVLAEGVDSFGKKALYPKTSIINYMAQGESKRIELMTNAGGTKFFNATINKITAVPAE